MARNARRRRGFDFAEHAMCCGRVRFTEAGCKVVLPAPSTSICLSGSELQENHSIHTKLCDVLIRHEPEHGEAHALVVEVKSGASNAEHVHEQLQNGADLIQSGCSNAEYVTFHAYLIHRQMSTFELRRFRQLKVGFHGKRYPILRKQCGSSVA